MTDVPGGQVFLLPDLGEGLTEAEVVRWAVQVGDVVTVDQVVVEVETAKALVEVPTPYAGRVAVLHGTEGSVLDVGTPLLTVTPVVAAADAVPAAPVAEADGQRYREEERAGSGNVLIGYGTSHAAGAGRRRRRRPAVPAAPAAAAAAPAAAAVSARRVPVVVSPLVRRLARDLGVDLHRLSGTGPAGVITRADVEGAAAAAAAPAVQPAVARVPAQAAAPTTVEAAPAVPGERRTPLNGFRRAVSAALTKSRSEIPEATVWVDLDATELVALRERGRTATDPGPGLLAYLGRFTVAALRRYPVLNARIDVERQEIVELEDVNLGLAVQSDRGLVVPAVLGAQRMTVEELDVAVRDLTARARAGRATAQEMSAGTFTLNNYGSFRVDGSAAIIQHPQVAILGFGRILDRPWVVDGQVQVRKICQMSFVFDHRVCDGGTAAGFMRAVADAVEDPLSVISRL